MSNVTNWPARFAEMVDFVGFSEEDRQLIKASAPLIMAQSRKLSDEVYDRLLQGLPPATPQATAPAIGNDVFPEWHASRLRDLPHPHAG